MKQPYTVTARDIHTLPPNSGRPGCLECKGAGTVWTGGEPCREPCKACFGRGLGVADIKAAIAREATRLWQRDVGRGITTGKAETYIAFAAETYRETREAA